MRAPLLVLVAVVGCAPAFQTVPNGDWQAVAPARRAAVDSAYETQLARLQGELRQASAAVAAAPKPPTIPAAAPATAAPGDSWASAMQSYERDKAAARTRIAAATLAWHDAVVQYQRERVVLIQRQLDELRAQHELDRATAIDKSLYVGETYETAGYRGQVAALQGPRFAAQARTDAAHARLLRAVGELTAAKDAYAAIVRTGPLAPTSSDTSLELAAFGPTTRYQRSRHHEEHYLTAPLPPRIAGR
jgi:hypothetical protein